MIFTVSRGFDSDFGLHVIVFHYIYDIFYFFVLDVDLTKKKNYAQIEAQLGKKTKKGEKTA